MPQNITTAFSRLPLAYKIVLGIVALAAIGLSTRSIWFTIAAFGVLIFLAWRYLGDLEF